MNNLDWLHYTVLGFFIFACVGILVIEADREKIAEIATLQQTKIELLENLSVLNEQEANLSILIAKQEASAWQEAYNASLKENDRLEERYYILLDEYNYLLAQNNMLKEQNLQRRYPKSSDYSGMYWIDSASFEVYATGMPLDGVFNVAHHEIGHYYWFEIMDARERAKYCRDFANADEFVSDYAETECKEDFAELFAESVVYSFEKTAYERFDEVMIE